MKTTTLSFFRITSPLSRLWALGMMGLPRFAIGRTPDIGFWKLFGSGGGDGFAPTLNPTVFAILAVWPDEDTARARTADAKVFTRYRKHAEEEWVVFLGTKSVRGAWSGKAPFEITETPKDGPVAFLTRATIRPSAGLKFWKKAPNISDAIRDNQEVSFKAGIGELPFLQQVTFSVWPDTKTMSDFAHKDGPHAEAIKAVRAGDWFSEELFARFAVLGDTGTWGGTSPLPPHKESHP